MKNTAFFDIIKYALHPLILLCVLTVWSLFPETPALYLLIMIGVQLLLGTLEYLIPARPDWVVHAKEKIAEMDGLSLDRLDLDCSHYQPAPELLSAASNEAPVTETLYSNLLKSNCLVTGQPDWGSLRIRYTGPQIDQAGLLQYIVSFRNHNEFHEQCVERIYTDIMKFCKPKSLTVFARYTRRGGLDINPFRSSHLEKPEHNLRLARQ